MNGLNVVNNLFRTARADQRRGHDFVAQHPLQRHLVQLLSARIGNFL